jgi:2-keto-4-pentenoate hydratase
MTNVSAAAAALVSARKEGHIIYELPGGMPQNMDEAYAIQDGIVAGMGDAVAGWKVAFTNKPGQKKMGTDGPGAGPIFASYVLESPSKMDMPDPGLRISECEFAFRLKANLTAKNGNYSDDDIKAVIGSVHPAIEIVNRRLSSAVPMSGLAIIVDHGGNGAFAYGAGTENWESIDYANHPVRQIINGEEKAVGNGQNVMGGNPIGSITWLANHLNTRGHTLKAGDWVSSGSVAEMLPVPAGGKVTGDFGSLGTVEVSFS